MGYSIQPRKRNTDKWGFIKTEDFGKRLLGRRIDKLDMGENGRSDTSNGTGAHSTKSPENSTQEAQ